MMIDRRALLASMLAAGAARAQGAIPVVASFSILGDMVGVVGGARIALSTIVGPDQDAHAFQPSPGDATRLASARVMVLNGLGFEGWMTRLVRASGFKGRQVVASQGIATIKPARNAHSHDEADPHIWQDPRRALRMVATIAEGLAAADADGAVLYRANAQAYAARITELDAWAEAQFAAIPRPQRRVVTSHDAFGYLGARYGVDFLAPQGVTTRSEPSAQQVARLIQQIRRETIRAVFVETMANPRLIEQVAAESGARVGGVIFSDALSAPGGPAATYLDLMRHNVRAITEALAG